MKNKTVLVLLLPAAVSLSCRSTETTQVGSVQDTEISLAEPSSSPPTTPASTTPASTLPPDVTFSIDCSALSVTSQPDCDSYIATTRDLVYPILRELTGVSLSSCYTNINYTILESNPAQDAGGFANGPEITYAKRYSIEGQYGFDIHELTHTFSACSGALDDHVFHGILKNAVHERLNVLDADADSRAVEENESSSEKVKTSTGSDLYDQCRVVLTSSLTIAYFELGSAVTLNLYQATVNPRPANAANEQLDFVWGPSRAPQVQFLLEELETDYQFVIDVPECGY